MKVLNGSGITHLWEQIVSYVTGLGYTSNVGTITGITMNNVSKGTSGVVDLGTVITSHQSLSDYVQKSQTSGLLKNDGTVDTNSYALSSSIPVVPSNLVTGLDSSGVATAYTIKVVDSMPDTPDSSTIYLVTGS